MKQLLSRNFVLSTIVNMIGGNDDKREELLYRINDLEGGDDPSGLRRDDDDDDDDDNDSDDDSKEKRSDGSKKKNSDGDDSKKKRSDGSKKKNRDRDGSKEKNSDGDDGDDGDGDDGDDGDSKKKSSDGDSGKKGPNLLLWGLLLVLVLGLVGAGLFIYFKNSKEMSMEQQDHQAEQANARAEIRPPPPAPAPAPAPAPPPPEPGGLNEKRLGLGLPEGTPEEIIIEEAKKREDLNLPLNASAETIQRETFAQIRESQRQQQLDALNEKCNGFSANSDSNFISNLNNWMNKQYTHPSNLNSIHPNVSTTNRNSTNKEAFYNNIPDDFVNSYINSERKWVHGCECDEPYNPFTNCKCKWGQYYDLERGRCETINDSCAEKANFNSTHRGKFYNIMFPKCNFKGKGGHANNDQTESKCCWSCNHKTFLKLKNDGETGDIPFQSGGPRPSYSENDDPTETEDLPNLLTGGQDTRLYNSRPTFFYPMYNIDPDSLLYTTPNQRSNLGMFEPMAETPASDDMPGVTGGAGDDGCGGGGGCSNDESWQYIKRNLFNCVRTNFHTAGQPGNSRWGSPAPWGVSGSIAERDQGFHENDVRMEFPGRGWINKDDYHEAYGHFGEFSDPTNNSENEICNDTWPVGGGWAAGDIEDGGYDEDEDNRMEAGRRRDKCSASGFKVAGRLYRCVGESEASDAFLDQDRDFRSTCRRPSPGPPVDTTNWKTTRPDIPIPSTQPAGAR